MLDAYQLYMKDIKNIEPLSQEEEKEYFTEWKESGSEKARTKLYVANLRFVVGVAHKYANAGIPILELINEGNIGLNSALERFEYNCGWKFISYAVWYVRQAMLEHIAKHSRFIKITGTEANFKQQLNEVQRKLSQILMREATDEELSEESGLDLIKVRHMETMLQNNVVNSIDSRGDDNSTLGESIPDNKFKMPDDIDNKAEIIVGFLEKAKLSPKEINVLTSYYGINSPKRNLSEISTDYSHTRERMRQIKKEALNKLRLFDTKGKILGRRSIKEMV